MQTLGVFPGDAEVNESLLVATSDGDLPERCHVLRDAIAVVSNLAAVHIVPMPSTAMVVTFYLDGPAWVEWTPLVMLADGTAKLSPAPGFMVAATSPRIPTAR